MSLSTSLSFAWQSITKHRLRSFLALLGISVGALAVLSVVSIERSWQEQVDRAFEGLNLNSFRVTIPRNAVGVARRELTQQDAEAIREHCSAVDTLSVYAEDMGDVRSGRNRPEWPPIVRAIDASFGSAVGLRAVEGRLLDDSEIEQGAQVCLITPALERVLFPDGRAMEEQLRLEGVAFRIIGIVTSSEEGESSDRKHLYIPHRLYRQVFRKQPWIEMRGIASDPDLAADQVNTLMSQRVGGDETVKFVQGPWVAREAARKVRDHVQFIGLLAAFCALFLGSYSVGALLYVSVVESAREIGIRRALGAHKRAAVLEVVAAGVLFGVAGAGVGILLAHLGLRLAAVPGVFIPGSFESMFRDLAGPDGPGGIPSYFIPTVSWEATAAAIALSVIMCMLASIEPALEVSNLDPARAVAFGMTPNRQLRLGLAAAQVCLAVAVIALLPSLYESLDRQDRRDLRGVFRANSIRVSVPKPGSYLGGNYPEQWNRDLVPFRKGLLSPDFVSDLLAACPLLTSAEPRIDFRPSGVKAGAHVLFPRYGSNLETTSLVVSFVSPTYHATETGPYRRTLGHGHIDQGQFFTAEMAAAKEQVCVLDSEAMRAMVTFGGGGGVSQMIRVNGVPLRVVGTMTGGRVSEQRGTSYSGGSGTILVPITLYEELLPVLISGSEFHRDSPFGTGLMVGALDEHSVPKAAGQLRRALAKMLPDGVGERLYISEPAPTSLREYFALRGAAAKRSVFCAAALLLVALIGLANTLLVSLGEQSREAGIRRALGAQKRHVMAPLLAEGAALGVGGAALGVLVAWLLVWGLRVGVAGQEFLSLSPFWAVAAAASMVLTALLVSLVPGLLATRVDPAAALRSE